MVEDELENKLSGELLRYIRGIDENWLDLAIRSKKISDPSKDFPRILSLVTYIMKVVKENDIMTVLQIKHKHKIKTTTTIREHIDFSFFFSFLRRYKDCEKLQICPLCKTDKFYFTVSLENKEQYTLKKGEIKEIISDITGEIINDDSIECFITPHRLMQRFWESSKLMLSFGSAIEIEQIPHTLLYEYSIERMNKEGKKLSTIDQMRSHVADTFSKRLIESSLAYGASRLSRDIIEFLMLILTSDRPSPQYRFFVGRYFSLFCQSVNRLKPIIPQLFVIPIMIPSYPEERIFMDKDLRRSMLKDLLSKINIGFESTSLRIEELLHESDEVYTCGNSSMILANIVRITEKKKLKIGIITNENISACCETGACHTVLRAMGASFYTMQQFIDQEKGRVQRPAVLLVGILHLLPKKEESILEKGVSDIIQYFRGDRIIGSIGNKAEIPGMLGSEVERRLRDFLLQYYTCYRQVIQQTHQIVSNSLFTMMI